MTRSPSLIHHCVRSHSQNQKGRGASINTTHEHAGALDEGQREAEEVSAALPY